MQVGKLRSLRVLGLSHNILANLDGVDGRLTVRAAGQCGVSSPAHSLQCGTAGKQNCKE